MPTRATILGLAVVLMAGCATAEGGAGSYATVRDSMGITIVENNLSGLPDTDIWTVSAEPTLSIGSFEGDEAYQLFQVRGATRLSDGSVVVANAGSHELRFYDSDGRFVTASGGEGGGPGEFTGIQWVQRFGADSLAAYDFRNRRISIFGPSGEYARSLDMNYAEGGARLGAMGMFDDGTALVNTRGTVVNTRSASGVRRDTLHYMTFDSGTEPRDTLGAFPSSESYVSADGQRVGVMPLIFGRQAQTEVLGGGFAFASGDSYEIRVYGSDGTISRIVRGTHDPVPVTEDATSAYRSAMLDGMDTPQMREFFEGMIDGQPTPEVYPPHGPIEIDAAGYMWVQGYSTPLDSTSQWKVFDPEGRLTGTVTTPQGLRVFEIGEDYVLGTWKDELDVEYIRMHRIDRPVT